MRGHRRESWSLEVLGCHNSENLHQLSCSAAALSGSIRPASCKESPARARPCANQSPALLQARGLDDEHIDGVRGDEDRHVHDERDARCGTVVRHRREAHDYEAAVEEHGRGEGVGVGPRGLPEPLR